MAAPSFFLEHEAYAPRMNQKLYQEPHEDVRTAIARTFFTTRDLILSSVPLRPDDNFDKVFAARYLFLCFDMGKDRPRIYAHLDSRTGEELLIFELPDGYLSKYEAMVADAWAKRA